MLNLTSKKYIWKCKRLIQLMGIFIILLFVFSMRYSLPHFDYKLLFNDDDDGIEPKFCPMWKLNPFDPTILEYIKPAPILDCPKVQPYLTYVGYDGILQYNETERALLDDFVCYYKMFDRGSGSDDNSLEYDQPILFENPLKMTKDMVEISCTTKKSTDIFYWNMHVHPSARPKKQFGSPTEDQLTVLLMVIDSLSVSAMKRTMPLTYEYVTKDMNMFMFEGFSKVGENTQPIMVAALTGKRLFTEQKEMPGEIEWLFGLQVRSDNLQMITKDFAAKGYSTTFNEDRPDISIFNFNQFKGFSRKPTDYYYHSFWQAVQNPLPLPQKHTTFCLRNSPVGDIFVDIIKRQLVSMKDKLQFIFSFFNYYSHDDDGTRITHADELHRNFFRDMVEGGYLNRTAVIFMSDHGHRFTPMRKTLVGTMEDLNPFFGFWLPDWFYKRHQHIRNSLSTNTKRLTSAFDIHETLLDILNANYDSTQRPKSSRGMSLLYDLPENRTCTEAGIPKQYCLCIKYYPLEINQEYLQSAAHALEVHLNNLLVNYKECYGIKLNKIIRAEEVLQLKENKNGSGGNKNIPRKIRLVVETQPNQAVFEALLKLNSINAWEVYSDVQRLNAYKNSADCMVDKGLKKYCTCKQNYN